MSVNPLLRPYAAYRKTFFGFRFGNAQFYATPRKTCNDARAHPNKPHRQYLGPDTSTAAPSGVLDAGNDEWE
jgi:hypothetical protein